MPTTSQSVVNTDAPILPLDTSGFDELAAQLQQQIAENIATPMGTGIPMADRDLMQAIGPLVQTMQKNERLRQMLPFGAGIQRSGLGERLLALRGNMAGRAYQPPAQGIAQLADAMTKIQETKLAPKRVEYMGALTKAAEAQAKATTAQAGFTEAKTGQLPELLKLQQEALNNEIKKTDSIIGLWGSQQGLNSARAEGILSEAAWREGQQAIQDRQVQLMDIKIGDLMTSKESEIWKDETARLQAEELGLRLKVLSNRIQKGDVLTESEQAEIHFKVTQMLVTNPNMTPEQKETLLTAALPMLGRRYWNMWTPELEKLEAELGKTKRSRFSPVSVGTGPGARRATFLLPYIMTLFNEQEPYPSSTQQMIDQINKYYERQ